MDLWPASSPDAALLEYGIWGILESKAFSVPHPSINALKATFEMEWAAMSKDHICKVCRAFMPCLKAMVTANGGHFEN